MMLELIMLGLICTECVMYVQPFWAYRRAIAVLVACLLPAASLLVFLNGPSATTGLLLFVSALRVFNLFRLIYGRLKPANLLLSGRRSGYVACGMQMVLLALVWADIYIPGGRLLVWLGAVQYVVAMGLFVVTLRNLRSSHYIPNDKYLADRDLPSLTVAIPARNETIDLEDCLHSILDSDYPKLEVIVLDDSSQDRTPDIIKKFAHDGVRFVRGAEPDNHWLAKNFAYERLLEEASGELIVFCGVDVRFRPESLRRLVTALVNRDKDMVSIMPRRFTDSVAGSFIQPMRYWWELALPRRAFDRPPVLSTCWLIKREVLLKLGGFASVSHNVIPEAYFARELVKTDGYSFFRSDAHMGIETQKTPAEQRDTTVRVRYPQLHKRPELAFGMIALELLLLIGPFVLLGYDIITGHGIAAIVPGAAALLLIATHANIVAASSPPSLPIALVNYPFAVVTELLLSVLSMYKYEFASVIWKGRTITPAPRHLEAIPHLPDF